MSQEPASTEPAKKGRPLGILIVAGLMIVFGVAEVVTGVSHTFFGLVTSQDALSTLLGVALGACYFVGGCLLISLKKRAAAAALVLLGLDILGRIGMVVGGLYPVDTFRQTFAIVAGTAIAAVFAVYVGLKWRSFS